MGMKYSMTSALLLGLMLSLGSNLKNDNLFQVISSHPHALEELNPHITTVYQEGRLWVVEVDENAPSEIHDHLRPITGREKSYVYNSKSTVKRFYIPQEISGAGTSAISQRLQNVDPTLIENDVVTLSDFESRYAGSTGNQNATTLVGKRFSELGFSVKEICYRAGVCSLIADKKGSSNKEDVLMVMGHIDSVGKAFAGADDNASGVAVMLEMARNLKGYANKKNIRFFVSNGEELGLLGATHYAKTLESESKLRELKLVINMDMVGYNSNGIVELETDASFERLARWMAELADKHTSLKTKITIGAWGSDHVPFLRKNVPSILTIEDWDTKTPCYHQACDKPDTLNYEYAGEIAKLNLAAILSKDME